MRITRKQLSLLIETFLLLENKTADFEKLVLDDKMTQDEYQQSFKQNGEPRSVFKDTIMRTTLYNTLVSGQGHSPYDFVKSYISQNT